MSHLSTMAWDFADRLQHTERSGGGNQHTYFTYDSSGERVRKVYVHGDVEERIYLGGVEIYRKRSGSLGAAVELERETLHVKDDSGRIAMVETKTIDTRPGATGVGVARWRYQLRNHLQSASMELDTAGGVLSYEEYHPYGSTAFHTAKGGAEVSAKRYRYTGKERDEETGLYYHGARYYAPWLGRWTAADPAGLVDGLNLYRYSRDNPVRFSDPSGTFGEDFFSGVGGAVSDLRKGLAETAGGIKDFTVGVATGDNEKIISGGEKTIEFLEGFTIGGQIEGIAGAASGTVTRTVEAVQKAADGDFAGSGEAATKAVGNAAVIGLTVFGLKGATGAKGAAGATSKSAATTGATKTGASASAKSSAAKASAPLKATAGNLDDAAAKARSFDPHGGKPPIEGTKAPRATAGEASGPGGSGPPAKHTEAGAQKTIERHASSGEPKVDVGVDAAKGLTGFSGTAKPWTKGATPNSIYTHIDAKTGKAVQNAIYNDAGDVVGHVDFKNHGSGAPSGHGHTFPQPGNPASGHGAGKPHIPNAELSPGWDTLPPGVQPHTPIGK